MPHIRHLMPISTSYFPGMAVFGQPTPSFTAQLVHLFDGLGAQLPSFPQVSKQYMQGSTRIRYAVASGCQTSEGGTAGTLTMGWGGLTEYKTTILPLGGVLSILQPL